MTKLVQTRSSDQRARIRARTEGASASLVVAKRSRASATETYLAGKREGASRNTMLSSLKKLASILAPLMGVSDDVMTFPWHELDLSLAAGLRSHIQKKGSLASWNLYLSALRGVLEVSAGMGLMTFEQRAQVLMGLKHIKGHTEEAGRALSREEISKLFEQCDTKTGIGKRDALMLTLLFGCGLRCEEATVLDVEDVRREGDAASLLVNGKGGKQRRVSLAGDAFALLDDWLKFRGRDGGALLLTDGRALHRMSYRAVYDRVTLLAQKAGLEHVAPHDLRRTLVTSMLDAGQDLKLVSEFVGHSQLTTTARYDKRPEKRRREMHEAFQRDYFKGLRK